MRELTRHLVVFDIDGTLTRTNAMDGRCYAQALAEHLGVPIETDWDRYRLVTDPGIVAEAIERHRGRPAHAGEIDAVRERFLALLRDAREPVREVPGANALLAHLGARGDTAVAIATGCWRPSAVWKLERAGLAVGKIPLATGDDSPSREEIMRLAIARAGEARAVTYVGDGPWDVRAARALGIGFVGIACDAPRERLEGAGAAVVLPDLRDVRAFLAAAGIPAR